MIASLLSGIWGKFIGYIVAGLSLLAAIMAWRYKISKGAREQMANEIRERTIERVEHAREVEADVAGTRDDDILDKLRDNGWLRD